MITMRDINRLREMVRFELNKEIKKGVSRLVTNVRQRKNSELEFYSKFFLCPTLVARRITSFSISLPSSKLTISLILFINMMLNMMTYMMLMLSTLLILAVCRTLIV